LEKTEYVRGVLTFALHAMKQVLVIEDDKEIANLLAIHLTDMDCEVMKAFNGIDGLKKALETDIDLIILDISMPGMDGLEVCQKYAPKKIHLL